MSLKDASSINLCLKGAIYTNVCLKGCNINKCLFEGLLSLVLLHQNLHLKIASRRENQVTHLAPPISPGRLLGAGPGAGRERVALAPSVRRQARHQDFESFQAYHRDLWTVSGPREVPFASTKHNSR